MSKKQSIYLAWGLVPKILLLETSLQTQIQSALNVMVKTHSACLKAFIPIVRPVDLGSSRRRGKEGGVPELKVGERTRPAHVGAGATILDERDRFEVTHPVRQIFGEVGSVITGAAHELKRVVHKGEEESVRHQDLGGSRKGGAKR